MEHKDYIIRLENKEDYGAVESLVRESFWNVYRLGCSEHYVIHVLRDDPAFVRALDFVMEQDGRLIGQNVFMETVIDADDGQGPDDGTDLHRAGTQTKGVRQEAVGLFVGTGGGARLRRGAV